MTGKYNRSGIGRYGKVDAYFVRREYQFRAAVHFHIILWLSPEDERKVHE